MRKTSLAGWAVLAALSCATRTSAQVLDETWTVTIGGQTVPVRPDGSFRVPNVQVVDRSPVDFVGDEYLRAVAVSHAGGVTRYMYTPAHFQVRARQTIVVGQMVPAEGPPPATESLEIVPQGDAEHPRILTEVGQRLRLRVLGRITDRECPNDGPDGECDISTSGQWTTVRTSNADIVSIEEVDADKDGIPDELWATAHACGTAVITAMNDGAVATARLVAAFGEVTTVEGFVFLPDGTPAVGATVETNFGLTETSGDAGDFRIPSVPANREDVFLIVEKDSLRGVSGPFKPVADGVTDTGITTLAAAQYHYDFENNPPDFVFRSPNRGSGLGVIRRFSTTPSGETRFLGDFGRETVLLNLQSLSPRSAITLFAKLYVIRAWDGSDTEFGPDTISVRLNPDRQIMRASFSNWPSLPQSFPGSFPDALNPARRGAAENNTLGFTYTTESQGEIVQDSVYYLKFTLRDTSHWPLFEISAQLSGALEDESWGIDDVTLWTHPPEETTVIGIVADERDQPLEGALVRTQFDDMALTDGDGQFILTGVQASVEDLRLSVLDGSVLGASGPHEPVANGLTDVGRISLDSECSRTANLLVNPGAETGSSFGWVGSAVTLARNGVHDNNTPETPSGTFYFGGRQGAQAERAQSVELPEYLFDSVDREEFVVVFGALHNAYTSPRPDSTQLRLDFLASDGSALGSAESQVFAHSGEWIRSRVSAGVPGGTRSLRLTYIARRRRGNWAAGYIDDLYLVLETSETACDEEGRK